MSGGKMGERASALPEPQTQEAYTYTDGASTESRGPRGYGAVLTWKGKTEERMLDSGLSATMSTPLPPR